MSSFLGLTRTAVRSLTTAPRVASSLETRVLYPWTVAGVERPHTVSADKNVFHTVDRDGNHIDVIDYSSNLISTLTDPKIFTPAIVAACETGLIGSAPEHRTYAKDDVARRLIDISPIGDKTNARTWFGTTGSDAISTAVWASVRGSDRTGVVVMDHSFHGADFHASQVGTDPRGIFKRTNHMRVHALPALPRPTCDAEVGPCLEKAETVFKSLNSEIGCLVADGSSGSPLGIPYPKGFLPALTQLAHSYGIKVVIDEVMSGLKRCGSSLWAASARDEGVVADFVTYGKALTNGMLPLSAVVVADAAEFDANPWPHGSTFSGHVLGVSLCQAVLDHLATPEFDAQLDRAEALLNRKLNDLVSDDTTNIYQCSGSGIMWTIFMDLPDAESAKFRAELRSRFNIRQFGMANRVMISPTVDITEDQLDHLHDAIRTLSSEYSQQVAVE